MANKKSRPKKTTQKKTIMQKIGDKASHLKDELVAGKDHLAEIAGDAIDSVKSTIQHITKKKSTAKKSAKAKKPRTQLHKPAAKKTTKAAAVKKSVTLKQAVKKTARKK